MLPSIISSREIIPLPFVSRLMNSCFSSLTSLSGMNVAMYSNSVFLTLSVNAFQYCCAWRIFSMPSMASLDSATLLLSSTTCCCTHGWL